MKTKLYLDTSIPSAYFDTSKPVRQLMTQKWFENCDSDGDVFLVRLSTADFAFFLGIVVVSLFLYGSSRREKMVVAVYSFVWHDRSSAVFLL
jgi:cytochrome bd-type quinol oxidase subunit 1